MLVELRREAAAGTMPVDRKTTVGDVLLAWLGNRKPAISGASWVRYEEIVRLKFTDLHRLPASGLSADDIRAHLRTLSPAAGREALRILRAALTLAEHDGIVARNVAALVSPPKREVREGIALTGEQVHRLLAVGGEFAALWAVLFGTGARLGEVLALRWPDIDTASRQVTIAGSMRHQDAKFRGTGPRMARQEPKTAAGRRTAPLAGFAARALDGLPRDAVLVFHRGHGRPLNPSTVQRAFALAVEAAGLPPMRIHDARHTAATLWLAAGMTLDDVKRALGHRTIATTSDIYGHWVAARSRQMADVLDEAVG